MRPVWNGPNPGASKGVTFEGTCLQSSSLVPLLLDLRSLSPPQHFLRWGLGGAVARLGSLSVARYQTQIDIKRLWC